VPASLGLRAVVAARRHADVVGSGLRGPVAVTVAGRFMFLVGTGEELRPELRGCPDVVRHGRDSWIPVAPSRMPEGAVRWAVSPEETRWQLPDPAAVQATLVDAFGGRTRRAAVPRQVSHPRRAA
jgi:hypothetical protein